MCCFSSSNNELFLFFIWVISKGLKLYKATFRGSKLSSSTKDDSSISGMYDYSVFG